MAKEREKSKWAIRRGKPGSISWPPCHWLPLVFLSGLLVSSEAPGETGGTQVGIRETLVLNSKESRPEFLALALLSFGAILSNSWLFLTSYQ